MIAAHLVKDCAPSDRFPVFVSRHLWRLIYKLFSHQTVSAIPEIDLGLWRHICRASSFRLGQYVRQSNILTRGIPPLIVWREGATAFGSKCRHACRADCGQRHPPPSFLPACSRTAGCTPNQALPFRDQNVTEGRLSRNI